MHCIICGTGDCKCGGPAKLSGTPIGAEVKSMITSGAWVANRRIFLDADGNAVEANNPKRVELLVAEGASIPMARAIALGLAGPSVKQPDPETITGGEPATLPEPVDFKEVPEVKVLIADAIKAKEAEIETLKQEIKDLKASKPAESTDKPAADATKAEEKDKDKAVHTPPADKSVKPGDNK